MSYNSYHRLEEKRNLIETETYSTSQNVVLLIGISLLLTISFMCLPFLISRQLDLNENVSNPLARFKRDILSKNADIFGENSGLKRRFPQAIIIGAKKSGTRALLEFLRLNSKIKAPGPEVHFFDRHYDRGMEWYRQQMPPTSLGELTLEKTPSYLVTRTVPGRIFGMNPDIKLIIVLRDPVTRAISDYTQTASKRDGMPNFASMAFSSQTGDVNTSWGAIKIGLYHRHVKRWLRYFPLAQIHFVNGEGLISNPAKEVRKVEKFLNLVPEVKKSHFEFNERKGFPCIVKYEKGEENQTQANYRLSKLSQKWKSKKKIDCLGQTKGRPHPKISPWIVDKLAAFYILENDKLFRLIGQTFHW